MVRAALSIMLMAGLFSSAQAESGSANRARWDPPAKYAGEYKGEMDLRQLPPAEVRRACELLGVTDTNDRQRSCAIFKNGKGHMVTINRPFYGTTPQAVVDHEMGHLNGWPSDHPDE